MKVHIKKRNWGQSLFKFPKGWILVIPSFYIQTIWCSLLLEFPMSWLFMNYPFIQSFIARRQIDIASTMSKGQKYSPKNAQAIAKMPNLDPKHPNSQKTT